MNRLDYAREYKRKGWRLNILHPNAKNPVFNNWQFRDPDETEIEYHVRHLDRNYGLILDDVLVADKDGRDRNADLFLRRMGPFYSPHVGITRKGKHYYQSLPAGTEAKTRLRFRGMMLDLLCGSSRYVLGPCSVVEDHTYPL